MADNGSEPTPVTPLEPTEADHAMAAVDAALAPAINAAKASGPVHSSTLVHALTCVRQALAHVIYGAPPAAETTGESLDVYGDMRRAAAAPNVPDEPQDETTPPGEPVTKENLFA